MPYNQNIPQSYTIPAQDQPLILANFVEIATALAVDHGAFNAATEGQHNKISFVNGVPGAWPAGVTNGLYATVDGIFVHTAGGDFNITSDVFAASAGEFVGNVHATRLPSGHILKYGRVQKMNANGSQQLTFPVAPNIPAFAGVNSVLLTGQRLGAGGTPKYAVYETCTATILTMNLIEFTTAANAVGYINFYVIGQ